MQSRTPEELQAFIDREEAIAEAQSTCEPRGEPLRCESCGSENPNQAEGVCEDCWLERKLRERELELEYEAGMDPYVRNGVCRDWF